jgi:hypothetical protein
VNPDVFSGPPRRLTPEEWARESFGERPAPTSCQVEPPYPGTETVVMSIRDPWTVAHPPRRCRIETPHRLEDCAEFERRAQGGRG